MRTLLPTDRRPALVLAPMQDVTHHAFMRVIHGHGDPDWYVTEYVRVYENSRVDPHVAKCFEDNPTGRPVMAQMIGRSIPDLVRIAVEMQNRGAAGIDLNLGCPAPVVCRKDAGGGLLRYPDQIDLILGALRDAVAGRLTVKTRVGFGSVDEFPALLEVFRRHAIDGLTVHGRTVRDGYATPVHMDALRRAVGEMPCPVIANGNAVSVRTALALWRETGAAGVMIGRGAIRNPWIFAALRAVADGDESPRPSLRDVRAYIDELWQALEVPGSPATKRVQAMKKFMNFVADGLAPDNALLHGIRRANDPEEFHTLCDHHLDRDGEMPDEPPGDSCSFRGFLPLVEAAISR